MYTHPNDKLSVRLIKDHLREVGPSKPLTEAEEIILLKNIEKGHIYSIIAIKKFVTAYQYIVVREVLSLKDSNIELLDLIQLANLALLDGISHLSINKRNYKAFLSRHVYWRLRQFIKEQRYINMSPKHIVENEEKYLLSIEEGLCNRINQKHYEEEHDFNLVKSNPLRHENRKFLLSDIEDYTNSEFMHTYEEFTSEIMMSISFLSQREQDIITCYYGINRPYAMTLGEIGEELKLTRERVRQILKKAIERMSHSSRRETFSDLYTDNLLKPAFDSYPYTLQLVEEFDVSIQFGTTDNIEELLLLKNYIKPRERRRVNSQIIQNRIEKYFENYGRPIRIKTLKRKLQIKDPALTNSVFSYALRSSEKIVKRNQYLALKEWFE